MDHGIGYPEMKTHPNIPLLLAMLPVLAWSN